MEHNQDSSQSLLNEIKQKQAQIDDLEARLTEQQQKCTYYYHRSKLLDSVVDAVISSDVDFNIQSWNKAAEELYGWTEKEVLGANAIDLLRTQYFDEATRKTARQEFMAHGKWRGKMLHQRKDGALIPVKASTVSLHDDHGQRVGAVTIIRESQLEVEEEHTLKENEERYRIVSELMSDYAYLYHITENGKWYHVWTTMEAFKRVTGFDRDEMPDKFDLYHPDEIDQVQRDVNHTLAGHDTEGEYRIITKSGEQKWIYIRRRVLWDDTHQRIIGFYGAGQDITDRKHAEQRLVEFSREKERVNVLQNFIRDASHDLKTPLSTVNTSIYILRKLMSTDKQEAQLNKLDSHINHLSKLIEDMFYMSRLDLLNRLSLQYIDLNDCLNDVVEICQPALNQKQIQLSTDFKRSPITILADDQSLTEAFSNILDNAIQYTAESGQISIHSQIDKQWVLVTITDNGMGIEQDEIPHIFERFYRSDKARSLQATASTGLGLAIVRKIIELHDGRIDVESEIGMGTRFMIRLPRSQSSMH